MTPMADDGFQERMDTAARLAGNATRLAEKTGISRRAIGEYLAGKAEPSRLRLIAIAAAAGVRIEWLATGEGPIPARSGANPTDHPAPVDARRLATVGEMIADLYSGENTPLPPRLLARLQAEIYADLASVTTDETGWMIGLKVALQRLRRDLWAASE
ncbi:helix-turn-helix domain-containing protein [Novispirillum itersonii]|uniref:helix-turn-helix domain-containing protein n=1 Tax=Novispirillum itersonii TaxID=189 RepID=UPI00036F4059|nr:helix-turn-helix domain-containing protein [Novispirillum itersonii]